MKEEDWQHMTQKGWGVISYWKENVAHGKREGADRAAVVMANGYPRIDIKLPDDELELDLLMRALDIAFAAGERAKARKVRDVLEIGS